MPILGAASGEAIRAVVSLALLILVILGFVCYTIKKSEDPGYMLLRWVLTVPVVYVLFWKAGAMVAGGGYTAAFGGIPLTAVCGVVLAIIWRHQISGLVAAPFANLYTGGNVPPEPKPAYSIAQSLQKRGRYVEAALEVNRQLERFPTDFEGHLLLAQIQAEDLKDMRSAESTIQQFCAQSGHVPSHIVFALYSLADWHLRYGPNREAARRALEQVIAQLPDTEFALSAAQRIAHLGDAEAILSPQERKTFSVPQAPRSLGLTRGRPAAAPAEAEPGHQAADLVKHLQQHPLDTDAREQLARIYAHDFARLDLAVDQLEQLIQYPNQPRRLIVRWLNLMADLQVRGDAPYETIRQTLQRIIDAAPDLAAAEGARRRIELIRLELKANQPTQQVKMGTYDQNLGLKRDRPRVPPSV